MRLVLFQYPMDALGDHFEELAETPPLPLTAGGHVAIELKSLKRIQIAKIVRLFEVGGQAELDLDEMSGGLGVFISPNSLCFGCAPRRSDYGGFGRSLGGLCAAIPTWASQRCALGKSV